MPSVPSVINVNEYNVGYIDIYTDDNNLDDENIINLPIHSLRDQTIPIKSILSTLEETVTNINGTLSNWKYASYKEEKIGRYGRRIIKQTSNILSNRINETFDGIRSHLRDQNNIYKQLLTLICS